MRVEISRQVPRWAKRLQVRARYKGASGGRASGKSHFFAEETVECMAVDASLRFACIREVQRSLKFSAKSLIESKIEEMGAGKLFDVRATEILRRNGKGVLIFEGMQDHTADSIKSLERFGRVWVEEAQSISQRSLDILIPTFVRVEDAELWFSWNPAQPSDPVDKFFASAPPNSIRVHSTYRDNPFCPPAVHEEAERLRLLDPDACAHTWDGEYDLGGQGRVYSTFMAKPYPEGNIDESVVDTGGELYIGQDFNVNPMAWVVAVRVGDECHVIASVETPSSDTAEVAQIIKTRFPNRRIITCPDPAGNQRRTSAPGGQTDFTILRGAGFEVRAPAAHPPVVDRINNSKEMMLNMEEMVRTGCLPRRRLRVHPSCSALIDAYKGLTYKEGTSERDKKRGGGKFFHITDAMDYLLWQEFNVLVAEPSVDFFNVSM